MNPQNLDATALREYARLANSIKAYRDKTRSHCQRSGDNDLTLLNRGIEFAKITGFGSAPFRAIQGYIMG